MTPKKKVAPRVSERTGEMIRTAEGLGSRTLMALVVGQVGIHAAMAGLRLAAPLQALHEGYSAWSVGLLLALFAAAPVLLAMPSGRLADRHGYHRPMGIAVALSVLGAVCAVGSTLLEGPLHFGLLCVSAALCGSGTNTGMLAIQRTAGLAARDSTERVRIFSWLGVAPSFANVVGPVALGFMIDWAGFAAAYALMFPLVALTFLSARLVPRMPRASPATTSASSGSAWSLLAAPGMKRLLLSNWLLSACWDVHAFALPIIGHNRGFSASTIGMILGTFTLSVSVIRLVIPALAHRVEETAVIRWGMVGTGAVFALYPLASGPWQMGVCAALLGITLGSTQPMVMSTLHHLTPDNRHGETLAFRSMAINLSSTLLPLLFGAAGVAVGASALFWGVGALVAGGSWAAGGLKRHLPP
jgi:MFS family permease